MMVAIVIGLVSIASVAMNVMVVRVARLLLPGRVLLMIVFLVAVRFSVDVVMPQASRVGDAVLVPIQVWNYMFSASSMLAHVALIITFIAKAITVQHAAPRISVGTSVFSHSEVILLLWIPVLEAAVTSVVAVTVAVAVSIGPARPVRRVFARVDFTDVDVRAFVEEDITPSPATWPMFGVTWLRVSRPDEAVFRHGISFWTVAMTE